MFNTPQPAGSPLNIGDLVADVFDVSKFGVIVGPGHRGIKVSWWQELGLEDEEADTLEVDPLQLILLVKAAQC